MIIHSIEGWVGEGKVVDDSETNVLSRGRVSWGKGSSPPFYVPKCD